jgi:hypothetical protein
MSTVPRVRPPRARTLRARITFTLCTLVLLSLSVAACGGSAGLPAGVVANVGGTPITKATLERWMAAMLGGDYYELNTSVAPTSLLAPPPHHASCVAELERFAAKPTAPKISRPSVERLCGELYEAIKAQALTYLIRSHVFLDEAAKQGVSVSNQQLEREFAQIRKEQYPTEADLREYLTQRHLTLSILLFVIKQDLVGREVASSIEAAFTKGEGGGGIKAFRARLLAEETKRVKETTCAPGYIVARCRQYPYFKPGGVDKPYVTKPPAALVEAIGRFLRAATNSTTKHQTGDVECSEVRKHVVCKHISQKQSEEEQRRASKHSSHR